MQQQLRSIPFFSGFADDQLEEIGKQLRFKRYDKGEVVFAQGEPGDAMYIIEYGQVRVVSDVATQQQVFATLGPGDFFGEMALLSGESRSAGIVVGIDAGLWVLKKVDFDELLLQHPSIALIFSRVLSRRLRQTDRQLTDAGWVEGERLVAVIGDQAVALTKSLARQTGERVLCFDLTPPATPSPWTDPLAAVSADDGYDRLRNPGDLSGDGLARALGALAERYDRIVLAVPPQREECNLKALALAEATILLGVMPEAWMKDAAANRLWQPRAYSFLVDRLARRISRRTVGIALSSGSAHGLAHIGVLKVLEEAGVPIDLIAGTSIGSLVGAIYATGKGIPGLLNFAEEAAVKLSRRGGLWDFAVPFRHGFIWGDRTLRYIRRLLGDATFESLVTPLHIVAAELISGREVVLSSGPVAEAVRASISIPGLFVPFYHNERYFVDGGAVNPVPCSVLAQHGANVILAVNVTAEPEDRVRRGLRAVGRGKGKGLPSIVEALMGSLELMEYEIAKIKSYPVHVLIRPKTGLYDSMAAENAPELIRVGEEAAVEQIDRIQKLIAPRK